MFSGMCGAGKTFTADQVLLKLFQTAQKSDWLQNLRKVLAYLSACCGQYYVLLFQYWQVSSVVLKALGSASTVGNRDASRLVS